MSNTWIEALRIWNVTKNKSGKWKIPARSDFEEYQQVIEIQKKLEQPQPQSGEENSNNHLGHNAHTRQLLR